MQVLVSGRGVGKTSAMIRECAMAEMLLEKWDIVGANAQQVRREARELAAKEGESFGNSAEVY